MTKQRTPRIRITLHGEHIFDSEDDWGFPDAYESDGIEGVKELIREDVREFLSDLGSVDDLITVEVVK